MESRMGTCSDLRNETMRIMKTFNTLKDFIEMGPKTDLES